MLQIDYRLCKQYFLPVQVKHSNVNNTKLIIENVCILMEHFHSPHTPYGNGNHSKKL